MQGGGVVVDGDCAAGVGMRCARGGGLEVAGGRVGCWDPETRGGGGGMDERSQRGCRGVETCVPLLSNALGEPELSRMSASYNNVATSLLNSLSRIGRSSRDLFISYKKNGVMLNITARSVHRSMTPLSPPAAQRLCSVLSRKAFYIAGTSTDCVQAPDCTYWLSSPALCTNSMK